MPEMIVPKKCGCKCECAETNITVNCGCEEGGTGTSFPEAPLDGKLYGRKNAAWSEVTGGGGSGGGIPEAPEDGKLYGRKNKAWEEFAGGGFDGEHDDLTGIKGNGTYHLTEKASNWVEANAHKRPQKPQNISPLDGEIDVYQFVRFEGTEYYQPQDVPMGAMHLEIIDLLSREELQSETYIELNGNELETGTTYQWRIRYKTVEGQWSEWSEATSFTTQSVFEDSVIKTPSVILPFEGGVIGSSGALLISSPFAVVGAGESHTKTDWEINGSAKGDGPIIAKNLDDAVNLTSWRIPNDIEELAGGNAVYAFVTHKSETKSSKRSNPRKAYVKTSYSDPIIGFEYTVVGDGALVGHIDKDLNPILVPKKYFDKHSLWSVLGQNVLLYGDNHMAFIPPFWVKAINNAANKNYKVLISPFEVEGFQLHPAFVVSPNGFYFGRYYTSSYTKFDSTPDTVNYATIKVSNTSASAKTGALAANTQGRTGYHLCNIYQEMAVRLLLTVETGGFDGGRLNTGHPTPNPYSLAASSNWRNIRGLVSYSDYPRVIAGVNITYGTNRVFSVALPSQPYGAKITLCPLVKSSVDSYATELNTGFSDSHGFDMGILFLPKNNEPTKTPRTGGPFNFAFYDSATDAPEFIASNGYAGASFSTLGIGPATNYSSNTPYVARLCNLNN